MKKMLIMGAILLAALTSAQAQNKNTVPVTDGTTKNSGVGNGTNGSASPQGTSDAKGAVGADNGTSYGNQTTQPVSQTMSKESRKERKIKRKNKTNS
ncbi:hypothetical protein IC229_31870 [Spirosoma sp. BT702]|uniref:Uncharacterized protein n=1 Tax=Spirosoma profusum TaxID=2771354 RepID=A0A927AVR1_9BACT|nr:hypothetical protein [Spirosoma profusum]MBD2705259.1 hypothetical protein [Spirosoma profusum]